MCENYNVDLENLKEHGVMIGSSSSNEGYPIDETVEHFCIQQGFETCGLISSRRACYFPTNNCQFRQGEDVIVQADQELIGRIIEFGLIRGSGENIMRVVLISVYKYTGNYTETGHAIVCQEDSRRIFLTNSLRRKVMLLSANFGLVVIDTERNTIPLTEAIMRPYFPAIFEVVCFRCNNGKEFGQIKNIKEEHCEIEVLCFEESNGRLEATELKKIIKFWDVIEQVKGHFEGFFFIIDCRLL